MHRFNSFVTLTYNAAHLPTNNSLRHRDFQLFMKRLRAAAERGWPAIEAGTAHKKNETPSLKQTKLANNVDPTRERKASDGGQLLGTNADDTTTRQLTRKEIRFYMAGEYGSKHGRPHYHAILFGVTFKDKKYLMTSPGGGKLYRSATLEKLWPHGFSSIGDVTFETAAYVARYVMKKINGKGLKDDERLDIDTGEVLKQVREYNCMSRASGIGKSWLDRYHTDLHNKGKVLINGHEANQPRYYDKFIKKLDPLLHERHKLGRQLEAEAQKEHHTPERLAVQEEVAKAKTRSLKRKL